jgi:HAE1 family hydrophobic/amphiphilic exporter-1
MQKSFRELAFAFSLALLLVYMILAAQFESLLHPLVILLSIPLGLTGALLALGIARTPLSVIALIGIVMLAGIAVNNAIVLVDYVNQLRREHGRALHAALVEAGRVRLRPILMTTLTTMLGLLPMAIVGGRGAELRAPLAVSLFGGLLSSTVLTLLVVPVVYLLVEQGRERVRGWIGRAPAAAAAKVEVVPGD